MASIDNLFEGGSGKLGNLVFFKKNGKSFVRMRPARFNDRKSPAQLAQRQRMQVMNSFLKPFSGLIRITFASEATGRTALQAAQSYNMRKALVGDYPDIGIDKSRALLSSGPLPLPVHASVAAHPEGLLIEWQNDGEKSASDNLVMMAWYEASQEGLYVFTEARRSDGRYVWKLPQSADGSPDVWMAFRNLDQTQMSESRYLGKPAE